MSHFQNMLRLDEFMPSHLFSMMVYTFVSAIIAYLLGEQIEKVFQHEIPTEVEDDEGLKTNRFFQMSTLSLTVTTLLQCLAIAASVFVIHKLTSLLLLILGLHKTAYVGISGSRASFAASNVVIVVVLVHSIKTFNTRLMDVLNRLKSISFRHTT